MSFRAEHPGAFDLFDLHRLDPKAYPFLLQSVAGHPQSGRYDILFAYPQETLTSSDSVDFFAEFSRRNALIERHEESDLPFSGGWFFYLGYEAARQIEPSLQLPSSPHGWPDAFAVRCPATAIHDREKRVTHLFAEDESQLHRLEADFKNSLNQPALEIRPDIVSGFSEDPPRRFLDGVEKVLDYLRDGDTFQVNLSRAWQARLASGANYQDVYARLRQNNPAPFAGLACWNDSAILSSSPERLVTVGTDGMVQTRPIAGTRPRGSGESQDQSLKQHLIGNLKERAEHVMLIDLERNDLGRICEPGSIEVSELMTIESYAHVHHIVSNIRGKLRQGVSPGEVLRAVFPGGTITGCPKVRAMEIIAELEVVGRGPYTGAMGYLSRCGRMDSNILIRSLICEDGAVSFRAGAGIVSDSVPQSELEETRAKARGLLLALGAI